MKDWRGNEIEIGSRVMYAFNTSTSVIALVEGIVEAFPPLEPRQRIQRAQVSIGVRSTLPLWPGHWGSQHIKVNRLTVLYDTP